MALKEVIKPDLTKIILTIVAMFLLWVAGGFFLHGNIWTWEDCSSQCNPGGFCELSYVCRTGRFPLDINWYTIPSVIVLYLIFGLIEVKAKEREKVGLLKRITYGLAGLIVLVMSSFFITQVGGIIAELLE